MRRHLWTLRTNIAALLLATLVPLTGLTVYWIFRETGEERARLEREVQTVAELIASQVGQRVAAVNEALEVLTRLPMIREGNRQEVERVFRNLLADMRHVQNLGLVAPDGTILDSALPLPPGGSVSLRDREWLERVVRWTEPAVGGYQVGRITGTPNVVVAHPVLNEQGGLTAVVYAALDLAHAGLAVTWTYPGLSHFWAVVDEQDRVLFHSRPEDTSGNPLGPLSGMLRGEAIVPGTRWHSVVGMPEALVTAEVHQTLLTIGLPAGLILLAAAGVGTWIAYNTWRPLELLADAVRRSGQDQTRDPIPLEGTREVIQVATTFQEALDARDRRYGELTALLEATRMVASSLDLEQSLQVIVEQAAKISAAPTVRLFLLEEETQLLRCRVGVGVPLDVERDLTIPVGVSFSGQVAVTGKPVAITDTREDPRTHYPEHAKKYGLVSYLGVPVKFRDRLLGVLVLNTPAPRTHSMEEITLLSAFADQAAIAIENARLHETAVQRAQQLTTLTGVTQSLVASMKVQSVGREVIAAVQALMPNAAARLWDCVGDHAVAMNLVASIGLQNPKGGMVRFREGEGLAGLVAQTRRPVVSLDICQDARLVNKEWARQEGLVSALLLPLLAGDTLHGILAIFTREPRAFSEMEVSLFQSLATHAAIALENARLLAEVLRRNQELQALFAVTDTVTRSLDLASITQAALLTTIEILDVDAGRLYIFDEQAQVLRLAAHHGHPDEVLKDLACYLPGEGIIGRIFRDRRPMAFADITSDPKYLALSRGQLGVQWGFHSAAGLPILIQGRAVGVIYLFGRAVRGFTPEDLGLLSAIGGQVGIAIEHARLHEAIKHHATDLEARVKERTAELEEALRVKAEFLAVMSHELRTPLNAVLGFSDVLLSRGPGDLTPKQERFLQQIHQGGKRLLELVSDILDLSDVEDGKIRLTLETIPWDTLVHQALDLVQLAAVQKQLKIATELDHGLLHVVADRSKLAQILAKLLDNAVKFTPEGGTITVRAYQLAAGSGQRAAGSEEEGEATEDRSLPAASCQPPAHASPLPAAGCQLPAGPSPLPAASCQLPAVVIAVADTGIGIPPECLESIFSPFQQVDASSTRAHGGAGIGLALVRTLVKLHGGRVWAESAGPGTGARFIVRLPQLQPPRPQRILVVEDEATIQNGLALFLGTAGYRVEGAGTGAEGLAAIQANPPDLLILDIGLPDMDGWEILKRVRGEDRTRDLPVLVLTGLGQGQADEAVALGADEFLTKPISLRVLGGIVRDLLAKASRESGIALHKSAE